MSTGYIQFAKPMVLSDKVKDVTDRLKDYNTRLTWSEQILKDLKAFEGKKITKRIKTFLEKIHPGYRFGIEYKASLILNVYDGMDRIAYFFLAYSDKDIYSEEFLLDKINLESLKIDIEKLSNSIDQLPFLVARYNNLLEIAQALVADASVVNMEYDFDIMRNANQ